MTAPKADNITWHTGEVDRDTRASAHGHRGAVLWFTGLSGSGKSTIAHRVESMLVDRGVFAYVLDGDNIRHGLNSDLGFSPEEREENIRRIGEVARLFADSGAVVLTAFISPYRRDRERVRALLGQGEFVEVFVDTPLEICEARDPKGLYKKARAGEISNFTGINAPYEAPRSPEVHLETADLGVDEAAAKVVRYLATHDILGDP
ncbi:MAG: adenylyl-sulfate kinase [Myxococcales bacterium]|nr:adenylyl-sulfate kinase [Myxococcales bacterium]MDH3844788.1 adenylyl-sulfate kinase [Myxococcales bacterium]